MSTTDGSGYPDKSAARAALRAALRAMPLAQRADESAVIVSELAAWERWRAARCVMLFAPLPEEPDLLGLFGAADGKRLVFPRIAEDGVRLDVLEVKHPAALRRGSGRLHEPDPAVCEAVPAAVVDLVLVPGLGFATDGARIGRGRGFYDRFLAGPAAGAFRCGIALTPQLVPALPTEPHDVRMHAVAAASGILSWPHMSAPA